MLLESFERSSMDKNLLKFLKNFASFHKDDEEAGQFQIVDEETREANVIVDSEIIDLDLMEVTEGEHFGEVKKEPGLEGEFQNITMKVEVESEQIQEAMEVDDSRPDHEDSGPENLEVPEIQETLETTIEEAELSLVDQALVTPKLEIEAPGSPIPGPSEFSSQDTSGYSQEVTIETAYEPQTTDRPPDPESQPDFQLDSQDTTNQSESDPVADPASEDPVETPKEPETEEKQKLIKVKDFGQELLEQTDEKLKDPAEENVDGFIKDTFNKFRQMLIEMNLKKYKKRDMEKIKKALIASGSESSNSEEESGGSESDDDYVLNLDREFQTKPSEPSTPVVVSSTKDDGNSSMETEQEIPTLKSNQAPSKKKPESEEDSEPGEESDTESSDMDKEIDRLIDFSNLDKIPTEPKYAYQSKGKAKKKKVDKVQDILDDNLKDDLMSSESEKEEEITEEQYLKQINDSIKANLLASSGSEEELESDLDELDDDEELEDESSDTDSLFMKKLQVGIVKIFLLKSEKFLFKKISNYRIWIRLRRKR
jgi:hypothetical protein